MSPLTELKRVVRRVLNAADQSQPRGAVVLAGLVLLAGVVRALHVRDVFRGDDVVLVQVDPWRYRFRIERLTEQAQGPLDPSLLVNPGRDDLMVATLGWTSELLGGGSYTVGTVLATYPVLAGMAACALVYFVGRRATGDPVTGIAAAAALAVTPANVYRTALGFGDHHAFDYLWLAVTLAAVVAVVHKSAHRRERLLGTAVLGVALAGQLLSWVGGPLLVAPFIGFVFLSLLSSVRADRSPVSVLGPLVASLVVATALSGVGVGVLSWQTPVTVALLAALAVGLLALLGIAELGHRREWSRALTASGVVAGMVSMVVIVWSHFTGVSELLNEGLTYFESQTGTVVESAPLFSGADPVGAVLSLLGMLFVLFAPGLVWVSWRALRRHDPEMLVLATYAWYFMGLSGLQRRFTGELSLVYAVLVGIAAVGLGRAFLQPPTGREQRRTYPGLDRLRTRDDQRLLFGAATVAVFVIAVTVAQVPLAMNNHAVSDSEYAAALEIADYAAEREWDAADGYVFSDVESNLMYNYVAHGEEVELWYSKTRYLEFLFATNQRAWHSDLVRHGTGAVVVTDKYDTETATAIHTKLHDNLGSARGDVAGVGRYRMLYRSPDGSTTAYTPVPGALLAGQRNASDAGRPGNAVRVTTNVDVPAAGFVYERRPKLTADGRYGVVVPYAGTYQVGNRTVTVDGPDVQQGRTIGRQRSHAHWALDEREGRILFDQRGNNHAVGDGLQWTSGVTEGALAFDGDSYATVRGPERLDASDGFTLSLWVRTRRGVDYRESRQFPRIASTAPSSAFRNTSGYQIALSVGHVVGAVGNGKSAALVSGPRIDDGRWHHVALTWDGTMTRLFVDGAEVMEKSFEGRPVLTESLVFGASADHHDTFVGAVDEVRFRDEAAPATAIRSAYDSLNRPANGTSISERPFDGPE